MGGFSNIVSPKRGSSDFPPPDSSLRSESPSPPFASLTGGGIRKPKLRRPCCCDGAGAPEIRFAFLPCAVQGRAERRAFSQAHGPMRDV